jgi:nucleoside-diphosphate-sugar epimerase
MTKLVFGCGYLGERVARRCREAGHDVTVVSRSPERAAEFERQGYRAIVADVTRPETLGNLPKTETVLFAVGFDRGSSQSMETVYAGGLQNVLTALPSSVGRMIYISTTGVYGSAGGQWVDEQTPPDPQREGGRASLAAERALAESPLGARSVVLRLGGIYGPGRIPFLDRLRAGEPIPAPSEGSLNLIHVDDAAAIVLAADAVDVEGGPRVYCVTDGCPVQRGEYYREVARRIGAAPPTFATPDLNSPRASRAATDRRVNNARMLAELHARLAYPDYQAGLAAILDG